MEKIYTQLKQYMRSSNRGFTIIELMVVFLLGSIILAMSVQLATSSQRSYRNDLVRTRLNQNLRSALDLVGIDVREAGENLTSIFPAVEIINGADGAPDQLVLRRNTLDEVLNICVALNNGNSGNQVQFALAGSIAPGCIYDNQTNSFTSWQAHRIAQGGTVKAFVYNSTSRTGQFVDYVGETDSGTEYFINLDPAVTWSADYQVGASAVYMIEEWRYSLNADYLQLAVDGDNANPFNIAFGISNMQIRALLQDGTIAEQFLPADNWTALRAVEVTLSGIDAGWNQEIEREVRGEFLPRNILSN